MNRLMALCLGLALLLPLLGGCAAPVESDVYTIADPVGDWGYPNPFRHYLRGPGYVRTSLVFEPLVWKDADGFVPGLARDWQYLADECAYRFHLQEGVVWHDGQVFTADDVVFSFDYYAQHPYGFADIMAVERVEAAAGEVTVYLKEPDASFFDNVAATLPILPKHIWQDVTDPVHWDEEGAAIGTGPYRLADYSQEHGTYLYEAFPAYYGPGQKVESIRFVRVAAELAPAALQNGEVDVAEVPPEAVAELQEQGFHVIVRDHDWCARLMINHRQEPLADVRFRQALAYAIDRQELVQFSLRGHGLAGSPGIIAPDSPWYDAGAPQYDYDPEMAQELLAELGYQPGEDGWLQKGGQVLQLELLVKPDRARDGQLLQEQLARIGIKVDLRGLDDKSVDARVQEWQFQLALSGHGGLGGDPRILNSVITGPGFNSARYRDEELEGLLQAQLTAMDREQRQLLVGQVQRLFAQRVPALTLYYPDAYWAYRAGEVELYFTAGGIGCGVPIPLNKLSFLE